MLFVCKNQKQIVEVKEILLNKTDLIIDIINIIIEYTKYIKLNLWEYQSTIEYKTVSYVTYTMWSSFHFNSLYLKLNYMAWGYCETPFSFIDLQLSGDSSIVSIYIKYEEHEQVKEWLIDNGLIRD